MKREALTHTKLKRLCRRMNIPTWQAVGLLECLWHLTAREAPRGNIGKLSNEDIALALDYRDDENTMIDALVECGWLDRSIEFRLIVHGWSDHVDDATNMRLARNQEYFADGRVPKLSRLGARERDSATNFYGSRAQTVQMCAQEHAQKTAVCAEPCAQDAGLCAQTSKLSALPEPRQSPAPPVPVLRSEEHAHKKPDSGASSFWSEAGWKDAEEFECWWSQLVQRHPNKNSNAAARTTVIELVQIGQLTRREFERGYEALRASWVKQNRKLFENLAKVISDRLWWYALQAADSHQGDSDRMPVASQYQSEEEYTRRLQAE